MPAKHQITEMNFKNAEQSGEIATDRKAIYDIFCQSANWERFLKHLQSFDDIPQILNEPVFDKAFKTAALAAINPKEREDYDQSKLVYSELKAVMDTSKEEGREEGIEIGEMGKARKIAKTMKDNGEPIVKIAEYTGLSNEEIERLW